MGYLLYVKEYGVFGFKERGRLAHGGWEDGED